MYVTYTNASSIALPGTLTSLEGKDAFLNGYDQQIVVSAVDAAYYQYYRSNSDEFTGATVQGNLMGAEGVFGSLVIVVTRAFRVVKTAQ